MGKRSHSEASLGADEASSLKRRAPTSALDNSSLALLQTHATDLAAGLEALRAVQSQDPAIQRLQALSNSVLPALAQLSESPTHTNGAAASSIVPASTALAPFKTDDIPSTLPPLPQIRDSALEQAAFTHSGISGKFGPNYERLEWLGDAYSEVISSILLYRTFDQLPAGRLSQLRELLIKNTTLGELAQKYGLVERAKLPREIIESKEKMKKVPGDIMEAYIAAVILADPEEGLQRVSDWLRAVFSMTIKDQIKGLSRNVPQAAGTQVDGAAPKAHDQPKVRLQGLIGAQGVTLRYEDDPKGPKKDKYNKKLPLFTVTLYMDGWGEKNLKLGWGSDKSKKDAGQKAALMALENGPMMKKFGEKKRALKAAQAEQ